MTCGAKAILIVTRSVQGTTTNVAQSRTELRCDKPGGHEGAHADSQAGEEWEAEPGKVATILRHAG